jgi:hypothetical protein
MRGIQQGKIDPHYMQVTYRPFFDMLRKEGAQGEGLNPSSFMAPAWFEERERWNSVCERSRSLLQ